MDHRTVDKSVYTMVRCSVAKWDGQMAAMKVGK